MQDDTDTKDDALRLLYTPMERLTELFQNAFSAQGYLSELRHCSWCTGTIQLDFDCKPPSSDVLRHTIFSVYDRVWKGKPAGLDCVYKGARGGIRGDAYGQVIQLFITTDPKQVSSLVNADRRTFVLDSKEYNDWKSSVNHAAHKRIKPFETEKVYMLPEPGSPAWRADEPIPTVTIGLFRI